MSLIRFDEVSVEFGDQPVLAEADLAIEENERICIIGRNGAGKSTTLKLISGALQPDRGEITRRRDLGISQLVQTLPDESVQTVRAYVGDALADLFELRDRWERTAAEMPGGGDATALEELQHELDARDGWRPEQRVDEILSDLGLPAEKRLNELSGGWRRRVSLARALVTRPDLLLLDEPTNHLDLETIRWLEDRVLGYPGSVVFITHDRAFLQRLATRIVEIDRGRLVSWPGDYDRFLRGRDEALHAEAEANARFDKKLAEEEAWIRQGIKARRTRNEGRVRALEAMREQAGQRRKRDASARIHIESAEQSGRKVIQMHNVSYGYGREPLIRNVSLLVRRGDRIGLIGNNGVGKSTLLRLMLGELQPDSGTVKFGTNLEIGYFDQLRRELDETRTVAETVGDGNDYVTLNGKSRHVIGYLKGFLFSPKRAQSPIAALSGGERNRVVLARLFTQPANLLVLDEPTNDLDVETLEVLEDRLVEYPGTLIVVSHDRRFLDNVVTSTLVFEADGDVHRYVGNFSDWQARNRELAADREAERVAAGARDDRAAEPVRRQTKLSYHEQRRLDALPDRIAKLEARQSALRVLIAEPGFYEQDYDDTAPVLHELAELERDIELATEEWLELEEKASAMRGGA